MALYDFAKALVIEAGNNIRKCMDEEINIETKSNPNDLVTNVDKAIEQYIYQSIQETYPNHIVIGEEGHGHDVSETDGVLWIVDPIDGTLNFVHQQENFAISIGIYQDGQPYAGFVYDVMRDVLYHAKAGVGAYANEQPLQPLQNSQLATSIIGINPNWLTRDDEGEMFRKVVRATRSARAYGSAALEIVAVAKGTLAAYITPRLQPWDFAGGLIILEEVGGKGTNLLGEPLSITQANSIVMGNQTIHNEIVEQYMRPYETRLHAWHARMRG